MLSITEYESHVSLVSRWCRKTICNLLLDRLYNLLQFLSFLLTKLNHLVSLVNIVTFIYSEVGTHSNQLWGGSQIQRTRPCHVTHSTDTIERDRRIKVSINRQTQTYWITAHWTVAPTWGAAHFTDTSVPFTSFRKRWKTWFTLFAIKMHTETQNM